MPIQCYHVILAVNILGCFLLKCGGSFWAGNRHPIWQHWSDLIHTAAGLWISNSSRYLACPQIASLIIHTAWLSLAWTSTDLPPMSGICRRFIKTCRRVKNRAKIMQRELGIRQAKNSKTPKDHTENKWLVDVQYELPLHLPVMSSQCFQLNRLDSFDDEHPVSICLWWCDE